MRVFLILLLVSAALAGCSGGDDTTTTTTSETTTSETTTTTSETTTTTSQTTTTTTTTTTPPAENNPPTATLSATTENGTFNVTFDVNGADQDGDELSWSLDADGDGTADASGEGDLPANYTHNFTTAGNYTANLTVSDGEDEAVASVDIVLEAGGGTVGQTAEASWVAGAAGCSSDGWETLVPGAPAAGVLYGEVEVDAATYGLAFTADFGDLGTSVVVGADFYDAEGARLQRTLDSTAVLEGEVPDGATFLVLYNCGPEGHTVSYTAA